MTRYDEDAYSEDVTYDELYFTDESFYYRMNAMPGGEDSPEWARDRVAQLDEWNADREETVFTAVWMKKRGYTSCEIGSMYSEFTAERAAEYAAREAEEAPRRELENLNHLRRGYGLEPYSSLEEIPDDEDEKAWRQVEQDEINYLMGELYSLQYFLNSAKPSRDEFINFRNRNKR